MYISVKSEYPNERAAREVLAFLRDTKVGAMATIAHPEEERGEAEEGEEGGPGLP